MPQNLTSRRRAPRAEAPTSGKRAAGTTAKPPPEPPNKGKRMPGAKAKLAQEAPAKGRRSAGARPKQAKAVAERGPSPAGRIKPPKIRTRIAGGSGRPKVRVPEARAPEPALQVSTGARHVTAGDREAGQRIDNFLLRELPGVPKSHVYRLLRSGQVRINGGRAKPERKLEEGDDVRIPPVRMAEKGETVRPPDEVLNRLRESVIHEDEHYLAIDKPAGYASHGGSGLPFGVIEAIRAWNKYEYIELCHRLDRDTSGVLLLAKTRPALLRAQQAFKDGTTEKRYFALLVGRWKGEDREVDAALVRSALASGERFMEVDDEDGKPSRSVFSPKARYRDATLCEVQIFSGRTHQIRVHALALGHPVAGDRKYGDKGFDQLIREKGLLKRMFLHSHFLKLGADDRFGRLLLSAPMPDELREVMDRLPTVAPGRR